MAITNATIAAAVNDLINQFDTVIDELNDWMTGAVGGGAGLDGKFPLTDRFGATVYYKAPAQLEDDVTGLVASASAYSAAAAAAQTAAETAETGAQAAETAALGYRDTANTHKLAAAASASAAATDAVTAYDNRVLTDSNVTYSEEWANAAEDTLVSVAAGGDGATEYSALHWAAKAAADAILTAADAVSTAADAAAAAASAVEAATFVPALYAALADDELITGHWTIQPAAANAAFTFNAPTGFDTTFRFQENAVNVARIMYDTSANTFLMRCITNSGFVQLEGNDGAAALKTILKGSGAGALEGYYAGGKAWETSVAGLDVFDPDGAGTTPAVRLQGPSSQYTSIFVNAGADFYADHQVNSGVLYLRGRTSLAATALVFEGDPDGESIVYRANAICGRTANGGWEIHAVGNDNPAATFFQNDNSTRNGFLQFVATGISYWRNETTASKSYIEGKDTGGTNRTLAIFDADGPALTVNTAAGGVVVGAPTGGGKGTGTINAQAVYDDNVLLTDYVFDAVLDGSVDTTKWDAAVPNRTRRVKDADDAGPAVDVPEIRTHAPARRFTTRMDDLDPAVYATKWQARRKLPAFDDGAGADEHRSVGDVAQRLLETCEVQAVHIESLRLRIAALEAKHPAPPIQP